MQFCPHCGNHLTVSGGNTGGGNKMECKTCPYQYPITMKLTSRTLLKRKELDDVMGGGWDNVDKIAQACINDTCPGREAHYTQIQIRSADEPPTTFYRCVECGRRWSDMGR
ncbi:DNA-directed RNA polymerases III 12.5 kDa polypeptide [Saitoella complicata NRRL Y-17804]|uniref:DNA-directed RNA polymerases III 12.5 kDa polypeptide n=1 Tax=Saitoella complicata (strain BCRC 22490 / CBS 7301 / JCM 7358 / NBRC 10748 / NRRL Y-17804) TaxID=698492 RepID=UPI0008674569|nr:DNA-directed RNA polymerases III 12.5 kDa polypeptide [Saitoella complicata NRRL Y-17804]ODQ50649.1 DNA-directed RNA polymerases III 12.5 kDa polypeptide [Saitoella complicata NRRL Y-17804]